MIIWSIRSHAGLSGISADLDLAVDPYKGIGEKNVPITGEVPHVEEAQHKL
jgi:hypothetical protein